MPPTPISMRLEAECLDESTVLEDFHELIDDLSGVSTLGCGDDMIVQMAARYDTAEVLAHA
jgi:hypothetical protein